MLEILQAIKNKGGQPLFVGGCVRDQILGLEPKDFDVEVYNMPADKLIEILEQFGKVNQVGVSFGVIKLTTPDGQDFDFTLPRRENKVRNGHKGFMVEVDHTMSVKEAASRRDFTINSMAQDPFTGEIFDFFNGQRDLTLKQLVATSEKFSEDPLRVLRGMQFAGRFELEIDDPFTQNMCWELRHEFSELSIERVWGEIWKWAVKSTRPSLGLKLLTRTLWIKKFLMLKQLINCPQDPEWHPEGDVWQHTLLVCDEAARIAKENNLSEFDTGCQVLAALLHDVGKPQTTVFERDHWRSPAHDKVGAELARQFLLELNAPHNVVDKVSELVREHMVHVHHVSHRTVRRFLSRLQHNSVQDILFLIEADHSGRPPLSKELPASAIEVKEISEELGNKVEPILMGRHLIDLGMKPGKHFGEILGSAFEAQLEGDFDNLEDGISWLRKWKLEID